jgi:hypothetical protein
MLWDALRYTDYKRYLGIDRLFNSCCCDGRWDEDGRGIGAGLLYCVRDICEDGFA